MSATYIKPRPWNGRDLTGEWEVTIKVDGWRALWNGSEWRSRADKPIPNLPPWKPGMATDCEVYLGSLSRTSRALKTKHLKPDTPRVGYEHLFALAPLDARLRRGTIVDPTADEIITLMHSVIDAGFEGLVLRQGERWIKVKPEETIDVLVTGWGEGEGKHVGRLGYLKTTHGDVGTGMTDDEREELWAEALAGTLIGQTVEVSCMQFTPDGKFRHPRFVRMRPDKIATNEKEAA
ncbi:hypothetical protein DNX69_00695 [Rhodopseudomonas palustris]|uniref:DNA ligase OB-like domain-containing protein n=1 Tax=Rhodopseudomonas palustris TaxID=1076 RepID=A0A323UNK9_RHOPL|nr:hypothetical protein [Rhodopseudomonas palustris]PZA13979.1 hypothetical protein DNX69_00695 [Rhodopseudomonas palustris]UYO47833.1 hypothetical protein KQX64_17900 [Rhodopseudomonas palustris]